MLCKWCGMESATKDQCSWCHRALTTTAEGSETASDGESTPTPRPPVTLRRAAPPTEASPTVDAEESPLNGGPDAAVTPRAARTSAPPVPAPAPAKPPAPAGAGAPAHRIIGVRRGKGGANLPAPSMPPVRPSGPGASAPITSPPRPHLPAPAILPASAQNRAGGVVPKSPQVPAPKPAPVPIQARSAPPTSRPAVPAALTQSSTQARAAGLAEAMPEMEPGGLADGVAVPRTPSAQVAAEMHVPAMGTFTPAQSKYYPGQVVDPASGTHYDVDTGKPTDTPPIKKKEPEIEIVWGKPITMTTLVVRYLCALAGILAISGLIAHAYKSYYMLLMLGALFVAGLLMPIMEVVPKQRDDSDDVWIFAILTMIFGPAIGLFIYTIVGIMRQTANPAVVGCFIVSVLAQITMMVAAPPNALTLGPPWLQIHGFEIKSLFINWAAFMSLVGWYSANLFHKFDE